VLVALSARARFAEHAAMHHRDAIANPEKLGELTGHDEHRLALLGELADEAVDLGSTPHVDAAGRLVEQEHVNVVVKEPRERHLLLIAARELADALIRVATADPEPGDVFFGFGALACRREQPVTPQRVELGQREVFTHRKRHGKTLALSIFAQHPHSVGEPSRGRRAPRHRSHAHLAGAHLIEPENGAKQLRAPRADEPRDAEHFAAMEREARATRQARACELSHRENGVSQRSRCATHVVHGVAGHGPYERVVVHLGDAPARDDFAVPEHREVVGNAPYFFQKMRNVEDCQARFAQIRERAKQSIHVLAAEARRGLVENENACVLRRERAADFDELLLGGGERTHARTERQVAAGARDGRERTLHARIVLACVDPAEAALLAAEHDVLGDREVGANGELLVHDGNAAPSRFERAERCIRGPVEKERTGIRALGSGDDAHQRALASTVLAQNRVHRTRSQREAHLVDGSCGPEGLPDPSREKPAGLTIHGRGEQITICSRDQGATFPRSRDRPVRPGGAGRTTRFRAGPPLPTRSR
jgi:hypothetical protein